MSASMPARRRRSPRCARRWRSSRPRTRPRHRRRGEIMKIGFIGLGTMGAHMAASLQKSQYKLVVNDVRREAAQRHLDQGAEWADTPKSVAEQCDIVFTSLPGPPEVEKVVFGADGLLAGAHEGMAYFDLSTNSQALVRRFNAALAEKKAFGFDAPVSGGPKGAETGKLAIWVGGDKVVYDKHKKVLDAIGDQASYIGPIGSATVAKLVHNMAGYAIQTALAEVFTMGTKAGMDPLALWKAVRKAAAAPSTGWVASSWSTSTRRPTLPSSSPTRTSRWR